MPELALHKFELAYYTITVQHVNHNTTMTSLIDMNKLE